MTFLSGVGHKLKFFIYDSFVLRADIVLQLLLFDALLRGNGGNGNIPWGFLMTVW